MKIQSFRFSQKFLIFGNFMLQNRRFCNHWSWLAMVAPPIWFKTIQACPLSANHRTTVNRSLKMIWTSYLQKELRTLRILIFRDLSFKIHDFFPNQIKNSGQHFDEELSWTESVRSSKSRPQSHIIRTYRKTTCNLSGTNVTQFNLTNRSF